jgi:hypothetical protein
VDSALLRQVKASLEAMLMEPLLAPLEASLGPVASLAFEPMLAQMLEREHG